MKSWFPSLTAGVLLVGICFAMRQVVLSLCGGEFIFPVDDTYIHVSMAKNLAEHGVWGIEASAAAFCSSSPLWTLLLAGLYVLFGVNEQVVWFLALAFNLGSLVVVDRLVSRYTDCFLVRLGILVILLFGGVFPCTTALGMEHAMHAFFLLATLCAADNGDGKANARLPFTCLFAFMATASRYESLFFLLPLSLGLFCSGFRKGWLVGVSAVVPVLVYGGLACHFGGFFLPNSLMLKGSFLTPLEMLAKLRILVTEIGPFALYVYLMLVPLLLTALLPGVLMPCRIVAASLIVAVMGHLLFAKVCGQLCRYEAYLTAVGSFVLGVSLLRDRGKRVFRLMRLVVIGLFCVFLGLRMYETCVDEAPRSSEDIYSQQVQMTRMMAALPEELRGCIALNDLGYLSLHGGQPVLDIWGLGSQDAADARIRCLRGKARYDRCLNELFARHHVRYAVYYPEWFPSVIMPKSLVRAATLVLENTVVCGSRFVDFCAMTQDDAKALTAHLRRFAEKLPRRAKLTFPESDDSRGL